MSCDFPTHRRERGAADSRSKPSPQIQVSRPQLSSMSSPANMQRAHDQMHESDIHSKQLSRTCRFCSKRFLKAEHLSRHERSHTKEKPYRCNDCGKSFTRNDTLIRHCKAHGSSSNGHRPDGNSRGPQALNDGDATVQPRKSAPMSGEAYGNSRETRSHASSGHFQADHGDMLGFEGRGSLSGITGGGELRGQGMDHAAPNMQSPGFALSPMLDLWSAENNSQYPLWQVGDDFDWDAFNTSLLSPAAAAASTWTASGAQAQNSVEYMPSASFQSPSPTSLDVIQGLWVTKADDTGRKNDEMSYSVAPTRPASPNGMSPTAVDERYRDDLSKRMRPRWKEDPLPSTEYLVSLVSAVQSQLTPQNLALQLFFTRFNPIFPLLHGPTFRPSNHNSLLLLSICSIGSLFMGSNGATAQGSKIFERLNKVVLASWENILTKNSPERTSLVQSSILGQTFGFLSGNPKHLATVESFHGTVISWARRDGMFNPAPVPFPSNFQSPEELDNAWNTWARAEEKTRTAMGLYIHDAQLASLFHHDPVLRHNSIQLSVAASNEAFSAPSAAQWAQIMRKFPQSQISVQQCLHFRHFRSLEQHPLPQELSCRHSRMSCYVILHGIEAAAQEARQNSPELIDKSIISELENSLICWYHAYESIGATGHPDYFCLKILWHKVFMSLLADFDALERAIGRDGSADAVTALAYANPWASSTEAKRCVIHASLISRHMGAMRVDAEPAIHVPRCMFLAAIAWYCYIKFGNPDSTSITATRSLDFPEMESLDVNAEQLLFEASGFKKGKPSINEASPLSRLTDMLHKIGHWDISRRFARILSLLIHGDTDHHLVNYS